jgi:hypothetical protein
LEIWEAGKDLINQSQPKVAREAGWQLLTACAKHQYSTDLERMGYFLTLSGPAHPDDFHLQLAAVEDLTGGGRELSGFEYDIFPLLTRWLREVYAAVKVRRRQASISRSKSGAGKGKMSVSGEDKNFSQLFAFLQKVIKFNFRVASDQDAGLLLDELCNICENTSVEEDIRACIQVIDSIVTFGTIPGDRLKPCINVLSSILSVVEELQKEAWHTVSNICRSHHGQSVVRISIETLKSYSSAEPDRESVRVVRGALLILQRLLAKSNEKGYPTVSFNLLMQGLKNVAVVKSSKIALDVLKLLNGLLDDSDGSIHEAIAEEDWSDLFWVATQCAAHATRTQTMSRLSDYDSDQESVAYQLIQLIGRVEALIKIHTAELLQRDECVHFLASMHQALPNSTVSLLLEHYMEGRLCYPSEPGWRENVQLVIEGIFHDRSLNTATRIHALAVIKDLYKVVELNLAIPNTPGEEPTERRDAEEVVSETTELDEKALLFDLVKRILADVEEEGDVVVLSDLVAFLVHVAEATDTEVFIHIMDRLKRVVAAQRAKGPTALLSSPATTAQVTSAPGSIDQAMVAGESLSNVVTRGYVHMFMRAMNWDVVKAGDVFQELVYVARSKDCEPDARLSAMKLLFRLRATWDHHIFLASNTESDLLAASLYRTEASLARKLAEEATQPPRATRGEQANTTRIVRGKSFTQDRALPTRAVSETSASRTSTGRAFTQTALRLWSLPDPDALPQEPSEAVSIFLFSVAEEVPESEEGPGRKTAVLNIAAWLEALVAILQHGCDWEVYSFVLVHLPAQLSNHPVFEDSTSIVAIQELRKQLCELIRANSYQEPPISSGLRKSDVANCLFQSITTLVSYHPYFRKSDEDDIVQALRIGLSDKTAKTCIHALSVCCHEIPMSVSASLIPILTKMSQVITQPFVAMHILEFLACLSRLHSLYSNFQTEEYRVVFAIAFRYLQSVRDKKRSALLRHNSPFGDQQSPGTVGASTHHDHNAADDLPQYVYAIAYHVVIFWYLSLRPSDRISEIGWILERLFKDVDGMVTDEEAIITKDFMQHIAFGNNGDSVEDPLFREEFYGDIGVKRWIIGDSIVTIKQAKHSPWAEVTRRFPSGISSFLVRENLLPALAHEEDIGGNVDITLPPHLLNNLIAPGPHAADSFTRPIPLPDEDAVKRSIRVFDLSSTVDGHKVGVIYIGEHQTDEVEILANTSGSPEYNEFLRGLGTLVTLKGATFNTQGLDRSEDRDGQYTYCWRDRVTEIVFHITTQMPTNLQLYPRSDMKKRHIGNDFVNIIFNDSGHPFHFDTFPSEFNYVYIVITPNPRRSWMGSRIAADKRKKSLEENGALPPSMMPFFTVQVISKPGFPGISPAAEPKTVSLKALPSFVRLIALNASVFSHVWANRGGEHVGSWRARLRSIRTLRERYGPKDEPTPSPPASSKGGVGASSLGVAQGSTPAQQVGDGSRPVSGVRDSLNSLRRSSVATFFTSGSAATEQTTSHRASIMSNTTADNTEVTAYYSNNPADAVIEANDFSKWA